MRYVVPICGLGLMLLTICSVTVRPVDGGDRADRLARIEATLVDVLELVKRIEGFVGRPTPAPVLEAELEGTQMPAWARECRDRINKLEEPERTKRLEQLRDMLRPTVTRDGSFVPGRVPFDPSAPLPVNPKTGRSSLVEAMEEASRDWDEYLDQVGP